MSELTKFTEEQLVVELARRTEEKKKAEFKKRLDYVDAVNRTLTQEVVDFLVPEHDRTSCGDGLMVNGFNSSPNDPRCRRCAMLEALKHGWDHDFEFEIRIVRRPDL
jgi:hypothetical protein